MKYYRTMNIFIKFFLKALKSKPINRFFSSINGKNLKKIKKSDLSWLSIFVLVASFAFYFYAMGRNRYYVRSDVIVRKGASGNLDSGKSLFSLIGGGNLAATEDARFLKVYLESPQILKKIENIIDFQKVYKRNRIDPFAGLKYDVSDVNKFYFFKKQVSISINEQSGIIIIRTFGYQPDTSYRINNFLIKESESFVNNLNQDIYKKQLTFAKSQVEQNKEMVNEITMKLSKFQTLNKFLDADLEANSKMGYIKGLEEELVDAKLNLATLKRQFVKMDDPEIVKVDNLIKDLKEQIRIERQLMSGVSNESLNPKLIEFNQLKNSLIFAKEIYSGSLLTYEKTKSDSLQKQRFMAILREPILPDQQWQKWRHKGFLTSCAIILVGFSITKFILGMSDSHRN